MELPTYSHSNETLLSTVNEALIRFKTLRMKYIKKQRTQPCQKLFYFLFPSCNKQELKSKRGLFLTHPEFNPNYFSNRESNTKYNVISFIPFVILNQFIFFGNLFYLLMSLSQFIDALKVGFLFSYLSPLIIVLVMTLIKEFIDELRRYSQDKRTNNEEYIKVNCSQDKQITYMKIKSQDIKVGDVIQLNTNQRAPADLIILKQLEEGSVYIRTDQLDGETDWKERKVPNTFKESKIKDLFSAKILIEYEPPSKEIYKFEGVIKILKNKEKIIDEEAINLENTIWANTVLASNTIIGAVMYTGKDTRCKMNTSKAKNKVGLLDLEINTYNKVLFGLMVLLSFLVLIGKKCEFQFKIILFFRFIVLFCGIIPISLRVNLDLSKGYFSFKINNDPKIKGTVVRNSNIPEDLGRISYIFSDKTGTLTKNEMIFKCFVTSYQFFKAKDDIDIIKKYVINDCKENQCPCNNNNNYIQSTVRDTISAMILCNNVTPIFNRINKEQIESYQSCSPDEISLVQFAEKVNMKMKFRNDTEINIINSINEEEGYYILANFPFTSERKRMGIVLRNKKTNDIIFLLKGAENVVSKLVKKQYVSTILEHSNNLAKLGYRTLVLTQKKITEEYFNIWNNEYQQAKVSMTDRQSKINEVISKLENDLNFLCVTGVEDLLQDNISTSIQTLRKCDIKIWMLTGDKAETAKCISISTGLKSDYQSIFEILNPLNNNLEETIKYVQNKLKEYNNLISTHILLIENQSLNICLNYCQKLFFTVSMKSPCVICCRCSPTQKSEIVKTIKKYTNKRTLAIGDGGNDVSMILEADVGVGIVGKEGLQASLSSDFSIEKFENLNHLLLYWGYICYKNTSVMSNFVMHRGVLISFTQCIFSIIYYFNAVALYNGMLILGYGTIYTNFPAMSILLDYKNQINNISLCQLYKKMSKGRELSFKIFLSWIFRSLYQSFLIMFGSVILFQDKIYLKIVTVTFTEIIFIEILNVFSEIQNIKCSIILLLLFSIITYILSLTLLKNLFDVYFIFDTFTMKNVFIIVAFCWIPFWIWNKLICRKNY